MLNITFITSNITKLAHARHLSAKYDINVLHYKKKFYGVGYIEPRILDEMQLLEESMKDAIKRWKKNVSNNNTQLFFIEDTSVRIEALSSDNNDVPGADIKYWILENDFDKLDNELRKRGNNRKASVTSHIVLFLTDEIKKTKMINDEYIIFDSTAHGKIVDKEYSFETQILYPWLDNKTFNKWFVPEGFEVPISMLDISNANRADFRRGAFEEMYDFLGKYYNLVNMTNKLTNDDIFFPFAPLYLISGPTCAGKSTIGKYLLESCGYYHIEASDFMSLRYFETHGTKFVVDKNRFAAEILKVNPLIVVEDTLKYIQTKKICNRIIITGFRTTDEISSFRNMFVNQDIILILITADFEIRFNRWLKRHRDMTEYTRERFQEINDIQDKMGLSKIKKINDIIEFENNKEGLNILYNNFSKRFNSIDFVFEKTNNISIQSQEMPLERAILTTLAIEYTKNEYSYYTTTEIAHLINEKFHGIISKNKNNVSRYFNQSYYPYYEIKVERNKRKYKLSPTGYSEAKFIIHKMQCFSNNQEILNL